jgi:hypothetical protein
VGDLSNLPKWARTRLDLQEKLIVELRQELRRIAGEKSSISVDLSHSDDTAAFWARDDARIGFHFGTDYFLEVLRRHNGIEVRSNWGEILVLPRCSNVCEIKICNFDGELQ